MNYRSEMKKWYQKNIGGIFDKYEFIKVFRSTNVLSATLINAVNGFKSSRIYPWRPSKVNTKKLEPGSLYNPEEPLPEVAADKSFINDQMTSTLTQDAEATPPTQ